MSQVSQIKAGRYPFATGEGRSSQTQLLRASLTSLIAGTIGIGAGLFALYLARVSLRHQERERELLEAKLQAEHESQEKSTFLANMSHEIRTPMNAIMGFSELLSTELREPKHRQYLQSIRTSAASLLQLINDILDMSKVEAGVLELHPDPTDPARDLRFPVTLFSEPAAQERASSWTATRPRICRARCCSTGSACARSSSIWWATPSNSPTTGTSIPASLGRSTTTAAATSR